VGTVNVTVRFTEDELRRLDELSQRMGRMRSDVIRDLISKFDEVLRQEVEKERKRWMAMGFTAALEEAILDPTLILRFVRRNVDVLGYPDFLIGMVRVRNRVLLFSHQDKIGNRLLSLVRAKIEEEVRREEAEIEREEDEGEDVGVSKATQVRIPASRPVRPNTIRVAPVATKHKLVSSNKAILPTAKPTAISTVGRVTTNNGGGAAKAVVATSMPEKQKLVAASQPNTGNPVNSQPRNPNPQANADGSGKDAQKPAGQGANHGLSGDFVVSLITNLYHKHRDALLKAVEDVMGG
jgi:predicted transcriptional regulator